MFAASSLAVSFFAFDAAAQEKSDTATAGASVDAAAKPDPNATGAGKPKETVEPPKEEFDETDVAEKPGKTYYFVGLHYRGDVVPQFMTSLFVDEGKTIYSNSVGAELDIRKDNFSFIPALTYSEYGTGDILYLQKGKDANFAGNWSNVNSSLKAIYASAELLWSWKIHKNVDFEFGAGFGLGVLFGSLETSWVYSDPNGSLSASSGARFSPCLTGNTQQGCKTTDHQNASFAKINHYTEPFWSGGGSIPNIFPEIRFPEFGLRFKPIKEMEARLGIGFSLTGFWFGLSGDYGLERLLDKKTAPTPHDNPK
ncbi:MAG: hypothetical protein ABI421_14670 [Polyangiaceae bacterium]